VDGLVAEDVGLVGEVGVIGLVVERVD